MQLLHRLFSCRYMVKEKDRVGELPTSQEAYKKTFRLAWPSMTESVLVCLTGAVDTMMVGSISPQAISAVGITNQPKFILLALIFSLNVGITAVVARRKGEGNQDGANRCFKQTLIISTILAVLLFLLGNLIAEPLLRFAGAKNDIIGDAVLYFRIIMVGIFFNSIGLAINAAQRGVGNTRISMTTNLTANIVNVIFNYFLINGIWIFPKWGVAGAAVATALGNFVAFLMAVWSVIPKRRYISLFSKAKWRFDKLTVQSVTKVSLSACAEQVAMRIGFFLYAKIVADLGTIPFATHQVCMSIMSISFGFGDGFGVASATLVGQSLGAKRPDEARMYGSICQRMALIVSTVLFVLFIVCRRQIVGLFTTDATIIEQGAVLMIIMAFTTHAQTSQVIITGALRGAGDAMHVAITSLLSIAIIRPILTWILCYPVGWGLPGAWIGVMLDQYLRLIINYAHFQKGKWTKIKL